jgi:hypothetical protein
MDVHRKNILSSILIGRKRIFYAKGHWLFQNNMTTPQTCEIHANMITGIYSPSTKQGSELAQRPEIQSFL